MSTRVRNPVPLSRDPTAWICDGQITVGFLFDGRDGTVATLVDRVLLGTFKDWKQGSRAIHEARRERGEGAA